MLDKEEKMYIGTGWGKPQQVILPTTRSDLYDNFVIFLMTSTNPSLNSF